LEKNFTRDLISYSSVQFLGGSAHSLCLAFIALAIPSLTGSVVPILKTSIARCSKPEERSKEFAKFALIKGGMTALGPLVGLFSSYSSSFLFSAVLSLSALACTSLLQFPTSQNIALSSQEDSFPFWRQHSGFLSVFFLIFLCYCLFIKFTPLILAKRFDSQWVNYFFLIFGLSVIFNQFVFLRFLHLTEKSIPFLLMLLFVSIGGFCFMPSHVFSVSWLFVSFFCFSLATVQIESTLSLTASSFNQGKIQGIMFSVENASYLCAPLLGGLLAAHHPIYAIESAAIAAGLALLLCYIPHKWAFCEKNKTKL
jgi:hypothetical protein